VVIKRAAAFGGDLASHDAPHTFGFFHDPGWCRSSGSYGESSTRNPSTMIESMTYDSTHNHRPSVSKFTIQNKCTYAVNPVIANTNCEYSPREFFQCSTRRDRRKRNRSDAHHLHLLNPRFGDEGSQSHFFILTMIDEGLPFLFFLPVHSVSSRLQHTWSWWGPESSNPVHGCSTRPNRTWHVQGHHDQRPVERQDFQSEREVWGEG